MIDCRSGRDLGMHRIEGERFQNDGVADRRVAQIEQHVEPLGRGEKRFVRAQRCGQQAAVVADHNKRDSSAGRGAEREPQRARIARVQDSKAI